MQIGGEDLDLLRPRRQRREQSSIVVKDASPLVVGPTFLPYVFGLRRVVIASSALSACSHWEYEQRQEHRAGRADLLTNAHTHT